MSRFLSRAIGAIGALFHRARVDRDLDDELRAYLEAAIDRHMHAGLGREAATRAARIEIGSMTAVKQRVRDTGWESHVDALGIRRGRVAASRSSSPRRGRRSGLQSYCSSVRRDSHSRSRRRRT